MKASIEKIKEKFGVGQNTPESKEPVVSNEYGFQEYDFQIYSITPKGLKP